MIKDTADVRAVVVDRGTFFPVAKRLARDMTVFYHMPNGDAFKTFAKGVLGDGHDDVTLIEDFWKIKDTVDLFVFPDCTDAGLQRELQAQGFPTWGSKDAGELEENRGAWIKKCKELEFPMPKTQVIMGVTNLWLFLSEHEDEIYHIKISRWRGDMETWKACDPIQIQNKLDALSIHFGPFKEKVPFYVQENLETDIEGGSDTYFVGDYPDKIILGYEKKGESYFAVVKDRKDMPKEIWDVSEKIAPTLRDSDYCNMVSSEVRVKGKKSYWLDPCFRFPSPAGEEELELYKNFSDIVWHGANGELVQPDIEEEFCGEAVISFNGDKEAWKSFAIPEDVKQWVKLYACAYSDGQYHYPPAQDHEAVGCAVAQGHTPEEVIDRLKDIQEQLKDAPLDLHIIEIADLFKQIEKAEKLGIEFSDEPLPEPATVIE